MAQYDEYIWLYLKAKLGNEYGVAGLMGNLNAESGLRPNNLQGSYETSLGYSDESYTSAVDSGAYTEYQFVHDSAGYGLAQWTYWSRKQRMYTFWKERGYDSIGNIDMGLDFLVHELKTYYSGIWNALKKATSVREASNIVLLQYERPKDQSESAQDKRAGYSQTFYDRYTGTGEAGTDTGEDTFIKKKSKLSMMMLYIASKKVK